MPLATCFIYTFISFYAFSGTNLLTRCHSASSLFSAVFGFRKAVKEIFSELDESKAKVPIFLGSFQNTEEETERGHEAATPCGGAAPFLAARPRGVGASVPYSVSSSVFWKLPRKIGTLAFDSSNSENIFLDRKSVV